MVKGIILAGGKGTRLYPLTLAISKQLLPIYSKPMIYYPLSVLMMAKIQEILIISSKNDLPHFEKILQDGNNWGISLSYQIQEEPRGLADAFLVGKSFIGKSSVSLILGDNFFYGHDLTENLNKIETKKKGAHLFGFEVHDPSRYGVADFDEEGKLKAIVEKPKSPPSKIAVTGLYFYDNDVISIAEKLIPSERGELEITDINQEYIRRKQVSLYILGKGSTWLDTGTYQSLMQASQFVQIMEERQGQMIACLEEIAYRNGWIGLDQIEAQAKKFSDSLYGQHLFSLVQQMQKKEIYTCV